MDRIGTLPRVADRNCIRVGSDGASTVKRKEISEFRCSKFDERSSNYEVISSGRTTNYGPRTTINSRICREDSYSIAVNLSGTAN